MDGCVHSPAEGFLLSRIDGMTPLSALREIGGLAPDEVEACIERWEKEGVVDFASAPKIRRKLKPGEFDETLIDDGLPLDVDVQRRILEFEAGLHRSDHELLGVASNADVKAVKRAYFKLSKEFHPDRYFRRDIGDYTQRLDRIFKRILEAYELMSDPELRDEVQRSKSLKAATQGPDSASQQAPAAPSGPPKKMTKLERLRARMPIRLPSSVLAERSSRAEQFFDESKRAAHRGKFGDAAAHRRLAIAFDPFEPRYREGFADLRAREAADRAEVSLRSAHEAEGPARESAFREALRNFEDALVYRPFDALLNRQAARCAVVGGDLEQASEYAQTAVEQEPERAENHTVLALVHFERNERGHALKTLDKALELDPADEEAASLKRKLTGTGRAAGAASGGNR